MSARDPDEAGSPDERVVLREAIVREQRRLERRMRAIAQDIARETEGRALQHRAQLLVGSRLPKRGATEAVVIDYALDPPATVTIALDAALDPREQVERWFKTARRYQKGAELGRERMRATEADMDALRMAVTALDAVSAEEAPQLLAKLRLDPRIARLDAPTTQTAQRALVSEKRRPFREFRGNDGSVIWVGRGARDNDELTTKIARPQDLFLHVHDATGAHVIVPRNKGQAVPPDLLIDAATLAHHFSARAAETRSDVTYTERRYVQKRRGSAAGSVQLLRSKTLGLWVEPARLARLMAGEIKAQT